MRLISLALLPVLLFTALLPLGFLSSVDRARAAQPQVTPTATGLDGNDCDHDGGNDPGDDLCTPTSTAILTPTPPSSTPIGTVAVTPSITPTSNTCPVEQADFNRVPVGQSVEGMGAVAPNVNIAALYSAVHVQANVEPEVYLASPNNTIVNGGLDVLKDAFGDVEAHQHEKAARFTFTFAPGLTAMDFKLHMLDFGDWNPLHQTDHRVTMTAFDASGQVVDRQILAYTSSTEGMPKSSDKFGNLYVNGDASTAPAGMPGNWSWHVSGPGITRVTLNVVAGPDPNFALDGMYVTFTCP